jgi:hypothetical protein
VEQELLNLQEHLSSPTVLVVFVLLDLLVLCVCFCRSFCPFDSVVLFSFNHYVVCSSSIYEF